MAFLTKEGLERVVDGLKARMLLKGSLTVAGCSFTPTALAAGGTATLTKDIKMTGYTPIGIVGTDIRSSQAFAYKAVLSGGNALLGLRNVSTPAFLDLPPAVWGLYTKD